MENKKQDCLSIDKDALFILQFMINNGFNPENYHNILELIQSAPSSISRYLKAYKLFLLSEKVEYSELEKLGIDGAKGYIASNKEIVIQKPIKKISLYPKIEEFDAVIAYHDWVDKNISQLITTLSSPIKDHHFVFSIEMNDPAKDKRVAFYRQILEAINKKNSVPHKMVDGEFGDKNKHVFMITRKY